MTKHPRRTFYTKRTWIDSLGYSHPYPLVVFKKLSCYAFDEVFILLQAKEVVTVRTENENEHDLFYLTLESPRKYNIKKNKLALENVNKQVCCDFLTKHLKFT